ncbi:hypothetical protein MC378_14795 [Polaribacter sp. MSW13]|uniref:Uncharacterized protein n=1 Tax=Polaribacter marinus TaxID=2916838 RepID=A0A9X2AMQ8_9FLAO|nr:hypothetical protein [Polaribacter marinus]MCI2230445.1 hypothetical protein [Polaribacter marinus]
MTKKIILYILLFISQVSFGQEISTSLKNYFSIKEIKELNVITDFFQKELCGNSKRKNFGKCVKKIIPKIEKSGGTYIAKKINFRRQKNLLKKISLSTFRKIWSGCRNWSDYEPKYEYYSLCFSGNENYIKFVRELGKTSGYLMKYAETLDVGGLGNLNFIATNILEYPKSMNIENRGVQIVFAIHYLTQNDILNKGKKAFKIIERYNRKKGEK